MSRYDDTDDPRRRLLVQALTAGLFSAGWAGRSLADVFGSSPSKLPAGQSIYRLSGRVTVNGTPADMRTRIAPADTVETQRNSEVVFVLGASSYMLRGESRMVLPAAREDSALTSALRLVTGKLLAVFGKSPTALRLETSTATIGIRGTGVYMESDPEQTYLCTCYGITDIASTVDPTSKDSVTASHHDRPLYILNNPKAVGKNIRRAPFINHTDQELMLIETLVGRTPPFIFPGSDYDAPRRDY